MVSSDLPVKAQEIGTNNVSRSGNRFIKTFKSILSTCRKALMIFQTNVDFKLHPPPKIAFYKSHNFWNRFRVLPHIFAFAVIRTPNTSTPLALSIITMKLYLNTFSLALLPLLALLVKRDARGSPRELRLVGAASSGFKGKGSQSGGADGRFKGGSSKYGGSDSHILDLILNSSKSSNSSKGGKGGKGSSGQCRSSCPGGDYVFTMTNAPTNKVLLYDRSAGDLSFVGAFETGTCTLDYSIRSNDGAECIFF